MIAGYLVFLISLLDNESIRKRPQKTEDVVKGTCRNNEEAVVSRQLSQSLVFNAHSVLSFVNNYHELLWKIKMKMINKKTQLACHCLPLTLFKFRMIKNTYYNHYFH